MRSATAMAHRSGRSATHSPTSAPLATSRAASTRARCTIGADEIPIAPAEPGAQLPATPFPGGFRTPALGNCGGVRAGPASETRHNNFNRSRPLRLSAIRSGSCRTGSPLLLSASCLLLWPDPSSRERSDSRRDRRRSCRSAAVCRTMSLAGGWAAGRWACPDSRSGPQLGHRAIGTAGLRDRGGAVFADMSRLLGPCHTLCHALAAADQLADMLRADQGRLANTAGASDWQRPTFDRSLSSGRYTRPSTLSNGSFRSRVAFLTPQPARRRSIVLARYGLIGYRSSRNVAFIMGWASFRHRHTGAC